MWETLKCWIGFGSISDGSICRFSQRYFDVHDYYLDQGGDGYPSHFYRYTCPGCGEGFYL